MKEKAEGKTLTKEAANRWMQRSRATALANGQTRIARKVEGNYANYLTNKSQSPKVKAEAKKEKEKDN